MESSSASTPAEVVESIAKAKYVMITCGAGLSASAGLDYTSSTLFARFFPDMVERGFSCLYQFIGHQFDDDGLKWGYLARSANLVAYTNEMVSHNTYDLLKQVVGTHATIFCATTNVDGLLHRNNHFPKQSVVEIQGTYTNMQCLKPCRPDAYWPSRAEFDRLLAAIKPDGRTTAAPPLCPHCGGAVFLQVRGGRYD
jgi:NAD-dependent SIR2 family protein deacetylase